MLTHNFPVVFTNYLSVILDEEGIDSGGLGKETFILLSKDAGIYAGPQYRNWLVLHEVSSTSMGSGGGIGGSTGNGDKKKSVTALDGGFFFTEEAEGGGISSGITSRPIPGNRRKSSLLRTASRFFRSESQGAASRRNSWREVTEGLGIDGTVPMRANSSLRILEYNEEEELVVKHKTSQKNEVLEKGVEKGVKNSVHDSLHILEHEEKVTREEYCKVSY